MRKARTTAPMCCAATASWIVRWRQNSAGTLGGSLNQVRASFVQAVQSGPRLSRARRVPQVQRRRGSRDAIYAHSVRQFHLDAPPPSLSTVVAVEAILHAFGAYVSMPCAPYVTWPFRSTILETDNASPKPAAGFQGVATMPHRLSLVQRLSDLRRGYSGETDSTVVAAVVHAAKLLDASERQLLSDGLDRGYMRRLLGHDDVEPLPADLRAAVLPEAGSARQCELEADILLAAGRAVAHLHPLPELAKKLSLKPGRMFRMVRSQGDGLVLHLERAVLGPLLLELLPRITADGSLAGVPGLRAILRRRHVELYLLYARTEVSLANISYRQWMAALAFAEAAGGEREHNSLRWPGNDPTPLAEQEIV